MSLVDISSAVADVIDSGEKSDIAVGIDFGTTNCVVCIRSKDGIKYAEDKDGHLIPSVLAIHKSNEYILVGQDAIRKIGNNDYAIVHSVKRLIPISDKPRIHDSDNIGQNVIAIDGGVSAFGKKYTIAELVAYIITYLKGMAEQSLGVGKINACVITVPAAFGDSSRLTVKLAAESAGLRVMRVINEPTAAVLGYGLDRDKEGIYAVYDFGGGTFDVSVLRMAMGVFQVISTNGDVQLGGDDIDLLLLQMLIRQGVKDNISIYDYKTKIRQLKHDIFYNSKGSIYIDGNIYQISLEQLEKAIKPIMDKTINILKNTIFEAMQRDNDIALHGIILVGGSSRIPFIKHRIQQDLGEVEVFSDLDPDTLVALGAAIKAYSLSGNTTEAGEVLIDVMPLSIGIEIMGGMFEKIIHRNTPIPTSASQDFTTFADNQTGIDLNILQGERELVEHCRPLGKLLIRDIEPMPAGIIKIRVNFRIDSDGILTVCATNLLTGEKRQMELVPTFGIDINIMKDMLYQSINNAKQDIKERLLIETVIESKRLITILSTMIEQDSELLTDLEKQSIMDRISALSDAYSGIPCEREHLLSLYKELEASAKDFVLRRIDKYLKQKAVGQSIE